MIYLDNAATTPVCPEAAEAAVHCMTTQFGNPSSTHRAGREARAALKKAREDIAASLLAKPEEIFFTAGGTEGDNWALLCGAQLTRHQGGHIISSLTEHAAVLRSLDELERRGFEVTRLAPGPEGAVSPESVKNVLRPDTVLVSLMLVNNETGALTDIPGVSRVLRAAGSKALLHTDAVQGYLKVPCSAKALGADMITLSGHKVHAPKGVGALYVRSGLRLPPLVLGGGQENGRRSGTENLPGICAFAAAVKAWRKDRDAAARMAALRKKAIERLEGAVPGVLIQPGAAPHILAVSLPGYKSEVIVNLLDADGICISKGSACKKGARSHVLEAMGLPPAVIDGTVRISLSRFTTEAEIDALCAGIEKAAATLLRSL